MDAPSLITAPHRCLCHFHHKMQCLATLQAHAQHVETNREQLVQEERRSLGISTGSRALLRSGSRMPVGVMPDTIMRDVSLAAEHWNLPRNGTAPVLRLNTHTNLSV